MKKSAHKVTAKKKYTPPELKLLGKVADLTAGGSGDIDELRRRCRGVRWRRC